MSEIKFPTNRTGHKSTGLPISADFNEETLIEDVQVRLGWPLIVIELDILHYRKAIERAFEVYSRFIPQFGRIILDVNQAQTRYKLPYVGRGVVGVQPNRTGSFLVPGSSFMLNLGDGVVTTVVPAFRDTYGIDEIAEVLTYSKMWRRVLSWDFQWEGEDGYLYVTNIHPGMTTLSVMYVDDHTYRTFPRADRDWLKDYTRAICKQSLGEIRTKFPTPGPAGQPMLQRTAELIKEGQEEAAALYDQIRRRALPIPPSWDDQP